ncbi:MAG: ABC transporter C-terminal domain-containing protein, partial [Bacteroidales bacterium]|nr:ABC transporter C-terminal domain-containing protein [Bacteroidales bacterium]
FVFEDNGLIKDYHSTYSDYMDYKKEIENEKNDNKDSNSSESETNTKVKTKNLNKATYKEKKEYELLNSEIPKLEEEKKIIMDKLSKDNQPPEEISTLSERFQEIERELEEKEMRWLELSELEH